MAQQISIEIFIDLADILQFLDLSTTLPYIPALVYFGHVSYHGYEVRFILDA